MVAGWRNIRAVRQVRLPSLPSVRYHTTPRHAMPTAANANAEAFAQPHWRVIASGFDIERWFADAQAVGTGGIVNPQPTRLAAGQYYYPATASPAAARRARRNSAVAGGWISRTSHSSAASPRTMATACAMLHAWCSHCRTQGPWSTCFCAPC